MTHRAGAWVATAAAALTLTGCVGPNEYSSPTPPTPSPTGALACDQAISDEAAREVNGPNLGPPDRSALYSLCAPTGLDQAAVDALLYRAIGRYADHLWDPGAAPVG